ncbi:MAG: hypothetical protein Q9221_003593 [Calogaya cf. arnoldii]
MSFHLQIANIFLLLVAFHLHQASTVALPIDPQTPPTTLIQPNPNHNISTLNELTVEQIVGNLVRAIAASPIRAVAETRLVAVMLRVDDNEQDITTSSNIASFRKIDVVFRNPKAGGGLRFSNRWPHHWDQWKNPVGDLVSVHLRPVAWDTLSMRMAVAWADQLLKIPPRPYRGAYGAVVAMQLTGRPLDSIYAFNGLFTRYVLLNLGVALAMRIYLTQDFYTISGCSLTSVLHQGRIEAPRRVRTDIKDILDIARLQISNGNRAFYDIYKPTNATPLAVQRFIDAGAIIVG